MKVHFIYYLLTLQPYKSTIKNYYKSHFIKIRILCEDQPDKTNLPGVPRVRNNVQTRSYYRKESAASPPRGQRQHAQFA